MTTIIARPINGIPLNGIEYLMDASTNYPMEFESIESAKKFIENSYNLTKMSEKEIEDFLEDNFLYKDKSEYKE